VGQCALGRWVATGGRRKPPERVLRKKGRAGSSEVEAQIANEQMDIGATHALRQTSNRRPCLSELGL
jgi:hypothetical protein